MSCKIDNIEKKKKKKRKVFVPFKDVTSHGIHPTFYQEAEKNCNTRRIHTAEEMENQETLTRREKRRTVRSPVD